MTDPFVGAINYSSVNEDWRTEALGLALRDGDRVLCVTGYGDRPLDLLAYADARVVAIDMNPVQNDLLRLKVAALRELPFADYAAFLGLDPAEPGFRRAAFERVAAGLPDRCVRYFRAHPETIERGVLYAGRFERHFARMAKLARRMRPGVIEALFDFDDLEAQRRFVDERWDTRGWRLTFRAACHPITSRLLFGDPAYFAHVDVAVGTFLYERILGALHRFLARESFMLSLIFQGQLTPFDLPPYLTAAGCETIRARLERVEITDADVVAYLGRTEAGRFDRFSLSDVPSYLTQPDFERLFQNAAVRGPTARLVVRQFLTRQALPPSIARMFVRQPELEAELERLDHAFAYSFIVADVSHAGS
jgi:S-adenosylmethionine-diacylglycerol 3-amino-3-carboxypropyl transferase